MPPTVQPDDAETDERERRATATIEETFARSVPFAEDRACAAELAREAAPLIDALRQAFAGGAPERARALEHHEALAMITLLGRYAGVLEITPTAALAIVPAVLEGLATVEVTLGSAFASMLSALALEGYVAAREERLVELAAARAAAALPTLRIAPKCLALVLHGEHDPSVLRDVVEHFGRALFEADARSCVVDLHGLLGVSPHHAVEVFGADVAARMLGATCVFSGASPDWLAAANSARVPLELLAIEPTFEAAVARALEIAGYTLKRAGGLRGLFRR